MSAPLVSVDELAAARAVGPVELIDVRQPEEYEAVHVPGAKLIPLADVVARTGEIPKRGPVYVICHTGPSQPAGGGLLPQPRHRGLQRRRRHQGVGRRRPGHHPGAAARLSSSCLRLAKGWVVAAICDV